QFPFFCAYTFYSVLVTVVRLGVMERPVTFFVLYWTTQIIYGILALLAIREVFKPTLEMYYSARPWLRRLPPFAWLAVIGAAIWQSVFHPVGRGPLSSLAAGAYTFILGV